VRVIAGALGGRRLWAPRGRVTRPSSDRVRESLFMSLEPLAELVVVDLFSGSGALGIEALSRGAARAVFVDEDRQARVALSRNLDELGLKERATVRTLRLPQGLGRLAAELAAADLVLADPPYGGGIARATLAALGEAGRLGPATRVVVEHHRRDALPERAGVLALERARRIGETVVSVYRASAEPAPPTIEEERHER
jgi:16S rRNA (guanine(966)-N(2))-methyltransferase RsmD